MLKLSNIIKQYGEGLDPVLKGINIEFRQNEFVSILGPSGCGKTTLLNIIGGLDKYTAGDLIIKGVSTKDYTDKDWDAYRNRSVGFVFQSYNLIPHLTVLENVSIALALSGTPKAEQKQKAIQALERVGLAGHEHKRPNQLSGGQMQRVAIARALVNDPEILLADEPTGALDTKTSVQIMDLLKEIATERLVVMVTHNPELAETYSTRIINLLDGNVTHDSAPYTSETQDNKEEVLVQVASVEGNQIINEKTSKTKKKNTKNSDIVAEKCDVATKNDSKAIENEQEENINENNKNKKKKTKKQKTSMSFLTAFKLSLKNLFTKKTRTILTAFAGSIGIIGVALVLAFSNGFNLYIEKLQKDTLSTYPITISESSIDMSAVSSIMANASDKEYPEFNKIIVNKLWENIQKAMLPNNITQDYIDNVIETIPKEYLNYIQYDTGIVLNVFTQNGGTNYSKLETVSDNAMFSSPWQKIMSNYDFINSQYDVIAGRLPQNSSELVLVVDKYNQVNDLTLIQLGFMDMTQVGTITEIDFDTIFEKEYKVLTNDEYYTFDGTKFSVNPTPDYANAQTLKITGILRPNEDTLNAVYGSGIYWTQALEDEILNSNINSTNANNIVDWCIANPTLDPMTGVAYEVGTTKAEDLHKAQLRALGGVALPNSIKLYAIDFEAKDKVKAHLDAYNETQEEANKVRYSDIMAMFAGTLSTLVDAISYVLIAFSAISLIVSSIMIGIITYVSVIERTKEIGVLRSIGARKKDISRVFNAETCIIGLTSGLIGVIVTYLLTIPINLLIASLVEGMTNIAVLNPLTALILVGLSIGLTLISGLIPSRIAAKKDPVVALRSE